MVEKPQSKAKVQINRDELTEQFMKREPECLELRNTALFILEKILKESTIKIHSIPTRIKSIESFLDKTERYNFDKPFEKIDDVVGLRVICLFLSDIDKIVKLLSKHFHILRDDDKVDIANSTSFGYMSRHLIAKLGANYDKTIYSGINNMPFEIQVRTIAMDAWANISHYLDYKTDQDIPKELKRDFYALSGMFYVADKHFQLFFEQRERKQKQIINLFKTGTKLDISTQPINMDTLSSFLLSRFPDREGLSSEGYSQMVEQLVGFGYKSIGELEADLDRAAAALMEFEKDRHYFLPAGNALTVALSIASEDFNLHRIKRHASKGTSGTEAEKNFRFIEEAYKPFRKYLRPANDLKSK